MSDPIIAFVGGGNMARSLIGGLLANGWQPENIRVSDPVPEQLSALQLQFGNVVVGSDNNRIVDDADVVVLAVKPQAMKSVATALTPGDALVLSIAAGIRAADLEQWLGGTPAIVRCMPNTPALVKVGATGLYANSRVTATQRALAETVMQAVGITRWFDEEQQLDAVTAISGSGPAYFLLFMEIIEDAGVELGLPRDAAHALTLQTALGAATLAIGSEHDTATLRTQVTSKGGTTERALQHLESQQVREHLGRAVALAALRSKELAEEAGTQ